MTTVKIKFRASSVPTREGAIYYQVIHGRRARQIHSGCRLRPSEWDAGRSRILPPSDADEQRREYLRSVEEALALGISRFERIIAQLEHAGVPYTVDRVVERYASQAGSGGFVAFARRLVPELQQIGRTRTAERYATVINSFERFLGASDIPADQIDAALMMAYETFLRARGLCPNSSSYYMRGLRAIYNRAVEKGLSAQRHPFRHVYTGIDKTVKRAVSLQIIRRIRDTDLTLRPAMDYARDLFMFSFYTRGMSFVDMAYLRKRDLQHGILTYRRHKTNQLLSIKWERPMQEIVDKYDTSQTPYLLPIIRNMNTDDRRQYKNSAHLINNKLHKLGKELGLSIPLTSYVARHTWASIARSKNIPVATISEAMGHDSERTTHIYLASLDSSVVDRANSLILKSL